MVIAKKFSELKLTKHFLLKYMRHLSVRKLVKDSIYCHRFLLRQNSKERKFLLSVFITAQFSIAPITWRFDSRKLKYLINHIHKRMLRLIDKDSINSFDELLSKDNSFRIHQCKLENFSVEIFKMQFVGSVTGNMKNFSQIIENPYDLRTETKFKSRNDHTVRYGTETASFIVPRIWSSISNDHNECNSA